MIAAGRTTAKRFARESGLTLIELMLVSFLSFIIVLGIGTFQSSITKFFREGTERLRLQQGVHRMSQVMAIEVRKASVVTIYDPADPATTLIEGPAVRLFGGDPQVEIGSFRPSPDGTNLMIRNEKVLKGLKLVDLWFEQGAGGSVAMNLVLADRYGNESGLLTEITPRN